MAQLIIYLRTFYILGASCILAANSSSTIRDHFVKYGARTAANIGNDASASSSAESSSKPKGHDKTESHPPATGNTLINFLSGITVPHAWFTHFYALSIILSLFWAHQVVFNGRALAAIASYVDADPASSMTMPQVSLLWIMMTAQGGRRLLECLTLGTKTSSRMWIAHWAVGLAFYAATSVAIWIEGASSIRAWDGSLDGALATTPSVRASAGILLFLFASGIQHDAHVHLASLVKYSLPAHPFFQLVVCPHYAAECAVYLSLAVAGAPRGSLLNGTLLCALVFVVVNLGVTAHGTRRWYEHRFGADSVRGRLTMLPGIW